jgi:hypothetical protein
MARPLIEQENLEHSRSQFKVGAGRDSFSRARAFILSMGRGNIIWKFRCQFQISTLGAKCVSQGWSWPPGVNFVP